MKNTASTAGFSLLELMAVMVLMTAVLGAALGVAFQSQARSSDRAGEREARQLTRIALDKITGDARMAGYRAGGLTAIDVAEPRRLRIVADVDDGSSDEPCTAESPILPRPELVTFEVQEDGTLRRGFRCRNNSDTAWSGTTDWSALAEGIDTSAVFFRYFDADGNELGDGVSALSATERGAVRSVLIGLDLSLEAPGRILGAGETNDFTGQERVVLRNLVLLD